MATISKTGIQDGSTSKAEHLTRIIDALDGTATTEVVATGSFTGSFQGDGTNITGVTAEWDGTHVGNAEITGSLILSGSSISLNVSGQITASGNISSSNTVYGVTGSFSHLQGNSPITIKDQVTFQNDSGLYTGKIGTGTLGTTTEILGHPKVLTVDLSSVTSGAPMSDADIYPGMVVVLDTSSMGAIKILVLPLLSTVPQGASITFYNRPGAGVSSHELRFYANAANATSMYAAILGIDSAYAYFQQNAFYRLIIQAGAFQNVDRLTFTNVNSTWVIEGVATKADAFTFA